MNKQQITQRIKDLQNRAAMLHAKQLCQKVFCNSVYGYFGNKQAPIGDDDIASSITLTGQATIKQARQLAQDYVSEQTGITDPKILESVLTYGDTDSVVGDTRIDTNIGIIEIEKLYDKYSRTKEVQVDRYGHEIVDVSDTQLMCTTYDSTNNKKIYGRVKKLVRHKVSKKKYKVTINGKSVVMTEDHGCVVLRDGILKRVSPKDILSGDKMIYSDNSTEICDIDSVECLGVFQDEYVFDIEMCDDTEHTFFANNILIHNSVYLSMSLLNIKFSEGSKITKEGYAHAEALEKKLNDGIVEWAKASLNSKDCRLVFKREAMADVGLFLEKKRYVIHVLDDENIPCDKWKYTGVEVVRTTMPRAVKPHVKRLIETMLSTRNISATNAVLSEMYNIFKELPIEDISKTNGISNYEKYASKCRDFNVVKGMPSHVKASYYHNMLIDKLGLDKKYPKIVSGDKVKHCYVETPNKYGIKCIGFKYKFPDEFKSILRPDRELLFEKIIFSVVERFYNAVNWIARKPSDQVYVELLDMFGE